MPPKDCPFCRVNNLLKGNVIIESPTSYLIENQFAPGNYLIIPTDHVESITSLPDSWWKDVKQLLSAIPNLAPDYNISINIGERAGQSVKHVHLWIIPRIAGSASSGKGLITLMDEYETHSTDQDRPKE